MKICWITGLSESYYKNIAQDTLKTWDKLEGDKFIFVENDMPSYSHQYPLINIANSYNGFPKDKVDKIYNLGKKTFKFFKKAVAISEGLNKFYQDYDFIIWIDSDVIVENSIDFQEILPEKHELFSVVIKTINGCDSGFIAFNTKHDNFLSFKSQYLNYYFNDKIYNFNNPYDAYIIEDYSKNVKFKNLWSGVCTDKREYNCGFVDTKLSLYMTHYWGKKNKYKLEGIVK